VPNLEEVGNGHNRQTQHGYPASRQDDLVPFADSEELVANSGLPSDVLIEVGNDHRLTDPEPLEAMLDACVKVIQQQKE